MTLNFWNFKISKPVPLLFWWFSLVDKITVTGGGGGAFSLGTVRWRLFLGWLLGGVGDGDGRLGGKVGTILGTRGGTGELNGLESSSSSESSHINPQLPLHSSIIS